MGKALRRAAAGIGGDWHNQARQGLQMRGSEVEMCSAGVVGDAVV